MSEEETIVCALCGKAICRSERTIGLLVMHYRLRSHQKILESIETHQSIMRCIEEKKGMSDKIEKLYDVWSNECDKKHCPIIEYLLHGEKIGQIDSCGPGDL